MGIVRVGVILGGNFPRWELSGGNNSGGNFPAWSFPSTLIYVKLNLLKERVNFHKFVIIRLSKACSGFNVNNLELTFLQDLTIYSILSKEVRASIPLKCIHFEVKIGRQSCSFFAFYRSILPTSV